MFRFYAKKVILEVTQKEVVTSGSVNVYQCQFQFDNAWDGLEKTAVFDAGDDTVSTLLDETGMCIIPWEVLQDARRTLYAGVYGTKNGNVVLPTIWANCGEIKPGVTQGENTQPPTPDVYGQILQAAKDAEDIAQGVRYDADSGKFDGEVGPIGPQGYTYTPAVSEEGVISWANDGGLPNPDPVNITGPQGQPGETPDITVGTVETLDPDQDATANITGETPNLTLNLGIPKGQPGQEDVLELLETITVDDEETTGIVWNRTYQLKAAVCTVYLPLTNGDSGNMSMYVSSGLGPIGYASIPSTNASTSAKRVKFRFYRKAGEYFTEGVAFPNAEEEFGGATMYFREYATPKIVESLGPITYMNIQKSNAARLPLGTEIKLYGVRA